MPTDTQGQGLATFPFVESVRQSLSDNSQQKVIRGWGAYQAGLAAAHKAARDACNTKGKTAYYRVFFVGRNKAKAAFFKVLSDLPENQQDQT